LRCNSIYDGCDRYDQGLDRDHQILKILHVSPYFMPARAYGGRVESLYRLCLNLARLGCEVRVLATNGDGPRKVLEVQTGRQIEVAAGFEVIYLGRLARHAVAPGLLMRLPFEMRGANLVHLSGVYSFPTIPTLLLCRLLRKPLVWSPRGDLLRWQGTRGRIAKRTWEIACRMAAPRATMLQLASEKEYNASLSRFPKFDATVIPNAVRLPANIKRTPGDGTLRLGYIGRLHAKKGLDNLLEACRILKTRDVALSLVIAGSGRARYTRALIRKITKLELNDLVRMVGQVNGAAKREFFESIDLLVTPSHGESFATSVTEALAHAVPVIASRGTPWSRLAEKGCGLWVDNAPASLADAIAKIKTMPLEEMGRRGREWMAAEFSWDAAARAVCNAYAVMIQGKPALDDLARTNSSLAPAGEATPRN
jgi:glycosyltransferase involved in cell wall biosynthesis